ncbi:MAG: hypothetical protein F6K11_08520 [Leptolyngbya sp. SIO3F4]|nr:hypothetical protein [Leptolyngbya sp. SIO3F4]
MNTLLEDLDWALRIGAFLISLTVFVKGILEYSKAQRWKKAVFVADEVKDFYENIDVQRALTLLEWHENTIHLKPHELDGQTKLQVSDDLLISSLRVNVPHSAFTPEELLVRSLFKVLFNRFTMFDNHLRIGLFRVKDMQPFMMHWVRIIADANDSQKPDEVKRQLWTFIDTYRYRSVRDLCGRFGFVDY